MTQTVLLRDIGRVVTGKTPSKTNPGYWGDELDFITPTDFKDSKYVSPSRSLSTDGKQAMQRILCPKNSVIVTCIGSDMGKVALSKRSFVSNQQINTLIVDVQKADPDFVYYLLKMNRPLLRKYAESGGSTMPIINKSTFERLTFEIPELDEQKKIADVLGTIDEKIELNRKMNETLEQMGQALFRHYFIDNPEAKTWPKKSIYEIANVINGAPFSSKFFNGEQNGLPLIRIRDLKSQEPQVWTTEVNKKGRKIDSGDILVGMDAEFRPSIWSNRSAWLNQRVCLFEPKTKDVSKLFILETIRPQLAFYEKSKIGTTVIHLSKTDIDRFEVLNPPKNYMEQFTKLANPLYDQMTLNAVQQKKLTQLRDALLPRLISGKIKA